MICEWQVCVDVLWGDRCVQGGVFRALVLKTSSWVEARKRFLTLSLPFLPVAALCTGHTR